MKRHTQAIGVRKWAGGDLLELQSQPLEAIDRFFGQYGPCIVQGCKVTANGATADIAPGVVALNGQDATGAEVFMVAPFEGINGTSLPVYLKLTYTVRSRIYTDGAVKPIAYDYKATATTIRPIDSTPYLEITATGGNRFTDVIQDGKHRFITDAERTTWNDKETPTGAQSKATKALSDAKSYAAGLDSATNSLLSTHTSNTEKHITPAERTTWNDKASKAVVTAASDGLMSKADKTKLDGVATGANNYTHPATHPATIITENTTRRFITDAERIAWNDKASKAVVTAATDGLMSKVDKTKLDGIMAGANNYTHPAAHSATIITEDTTHRFVTDVEKEAWNSKATGTMATPTTNGMMSKEDKVKLDGVAPQANNYAHPSSHPATIITPDATHRFVTDSEKANWNAKASTAVATTSASGLLSGTDKAKLDGIDSGANYYSHPSSHPATIITPDATHRFVTDAEKTTWNAKASTTVANGTTDGLMSTRHWSKLMGIDEGANYYTHPTTHPATIITPDATHRFVTDSEKSTWNGKQNAIPVITITNFDTLDPSSNPITKDLALGEFCLFKSDNAIGAPSSAGSKAAGRITFIGEHHYLLEGVFNTLSRKNQMQNRIYKPGLQHEQDWGVYDILESNFVNSVKLPNGAMLQWGVRRENTTPTITFFFPINFRTDPTVICIPTDTMESGYSSYSIQVKNVSYSKMTVISSKVKGSLPTVSFIPFYWFAIGTY